MSDILRQLYGTTTGHLIANSRELETKPTKADYLTTFPQYSLLDHSLDLIRESVLLTTPVSIHETLIKRWVEFDSSKQVSIPGVDG